MVVILVRNPFRRNHRFDPAKSVGERVKENIANRQNAPTPRIPQPTSNARIIGKDQNHDR